MQNPDDKIKEKLSAIFGGRLLAYFPDTPPHHKALWVRAVFENLRNSVASGNAKAIEIACSVIEMDPKFLPFGKLIKSNLARAIKKNFSQLTVSQRKTIIASTLKLLKEPYAPRELEDYAKLVKKFPRPEYASLINEIEPLNEKAKAIQVYLNVH